MATDSAETVDIGRTISPSTAVRGLLRLVQEKITPLELRDAIEIELSSDHDKAEKNREKIAFKMTRVQTEKAQKLAREWKPTAPKP
jgi:hypothetical protein